MKTKQILLLAVATLSLAGCVMQPSAFRGDRYEDGSYYSAGDGDGGDYYYAPEPREDFYPPPGFYGPGFYGSGMSGYCPIRYRYCPSWFGFGSGWALHGGWIFQPYYDPFYDPWVRVAPRRQHYRRPPASRPAPPPVAQGPWSYPAPGRQPRSSDEPARPSIEPEPRDGGGERRRGRPPVERSLD